MPQIDFDGANSAVKTDKIQGQSGTTVTVTSGHNLAGDGSGLTAISVNTKVISTTYDLSTASGNQDITGFGFNPSALFHISLVNDTDDWSMGFTDFTTNRTVHTKNTTTAQLQGTGSLMRAYISSGNTQDGTVSVITDGIRIAWTKTGSPTGTYIQYLIGFK